jgi:drug/metabolite transporter (DMT)-like permease
LSTSRLGAAWNSAYILLTLTALFWAGNSVVGRAAREFVPPVALSFWRWVIALLILLPFAWPHLKKDWPVLRSRWPIMLLFGCVGIGAFNTLLYSGLQYTTALNAVILHAAQPAMIIIVGMLLFRDPLSRWQFFGVLLSLSGVLMIVSRGDIHALLTLRLNFGDGLILLAGLLWAIYSVFLRKRPKVHPLSFLATSMVIGVFVILPFYLHEVSQGRLIVSAPQSWMMIGYVSLFPSLIAYLFFNRGVELIGSARAGQFINITPAFGALLSIGLLGERLGLHHVIGVILIGGGILLAERRAGARQRAAQQASAPGPSE